MNKTVRTALTGVVAVQLLLSQPVNVFAQPSGAEAAIAFRVDEKLSRQDLASKIDAAMAQKYPKIVVNLSPYTKTLPDPVAVWVHKVEDTGGEVYVRSIAKMPALLAELVAALLPVITQIVKAKLDQWLSGLGDPAKNYNAMIVTDTLGGKNPSCFARVEFYLKNSKAWEEAKKEGTPISETNVKVVGTAVDATQVCPAAPAN